MPTRRRCCAGPLDGGVALALKVSNRRFAWVALKSLARVDWVAVKNAANVVVVKQGGVKVKLVFLVLSHIVDWDEPIVWAHDVYKAGGDGLGPFGAKGATYRLTIREV